MQKHVVWNNKITIEMGEFLETISQCDGKCDVFKKVSIFTILNNAFICKVRVNCQKSKNEIKVVPFFLLVF